MSDQEIRDVVEAQFEGIGAVERIARAGDVHPGHVVHPAEDAHLGHLFDGCCQCECELCDYGGLCVCEDCKDPACGAARPLVDLAGQRYEQHAFVMRVLNLFAMYPHDITDLLTWRTDGEYAPVTFMVMCSDTFAWATADCEVVTVDNLPVLELAVADLAAIDMVYETGVLFAARVRGVRPMRLAYPNDRVTHAVLVALFDACGPERDPKTEG